MKIKSLIHIPALTLILVMVVCLIFSQTQGASALSTKIGNPATQKSAGVQEEQPGVNDLFYVEGMAGYSQSDQVLKQVNQERQRSGAPPLIMDPDLQSAAMQRAAETALYFSHTRPDGTDCFTVSEKAYGENIAMGQQDAKQVMDSWMNSPGHRANILEETYQSIGIGYFWQGSQKCWVQLFGNKKEEAATSHTDQKVIQQVQVKSGLLKPYLSGASQIYLLKGKNTTLNSYVNNPKFFEKATKLEPQTFQWSSDGEAVSVNAEGIVTGEKKGSAVVTGLLPVSGQSVSKEVVVLVAPQKAEIESVKAGKASLTVSWVKDTKASGYQIIVAQNSQFTKGKKITMIAGNHITSKKVTKLTKKKIYYVKMRAYKQAGKTKLYSPYSKIKTVKVK